MRRPPLDLIAVPLVVVSALVAYGRLHTPAAGAIATFGFPSMISMKVWLAVVAGGLALLQAASAAAMWGRISLPFSSTVLRHVHRWSGTAAFVVTLPVAVHCLWSIGFHTSTARKLFHSAAGCAFYGVFALKMLSLRRDDLPRRFLPWVGAAAVLTLAVAMGTSAGWYVSSVGWPEVR